MSYNYASFYGDNTASPDTGHQFGPYNLGTCFKMLSVVCDLAISIVPSGPLNPDVVLESGDMWGVQWVTHGDSPLALPAFTYDQGFFWAESTWADSISNIFWTPAADTGSASALRTIHQEWHGQLPINQDIDLYVTTSWMLSSTPDLAASFIMRVVNTD